MLYQYEDPLRLANPPIGGRRTRRTRVLPSLIAFAIGLAIAGWFLRGDVLEPFTRANLDLAKARWRQAGIRDYDLHLQMNAAEYAVEVRSGIVTQVRVNGLQAPSNTWRNYSVDGLFGTLEQELENLTDPTLPFSSPTMAVLARVRFHSEWGYPQRYLRSAGPMGKTAVIEVRSFQRLSGPA